MDINTLTIQSKIILAIGVIQFLVYLADPSPRSMLLQFILFLTVLAITCISAYVVQCMNNAGDNNICATGSWMIIGIAFGWTLITAITVLTKRRENYKAQMLKNSNKECSACNSAFS